MLLLVAFWRRQNSKGQYMKRNKVSSLDVARLAGVSQSAVSRVFSKDDRSSAVSSNMRKRVMEAADQLGYRPNALARAVFVGKSKIVAVLFSYLDNPFYADALERICLELQASGYHALVFMMPETTQGIDQVMEEILQYQVDGMITASVELSSAICARCYDSGIPVVMFVRTQDDRRLSAVTADNVAGARSVAQYLARCGHKRIAMIAGWEGASTNRDRELGFTAGLSEAGLSIHSRAVGHFHPQRAAAAARELFTVASDNRPDAVFVANDYMAVAVMDELRFKLGLRVPDDVSVVGYDDIEIAGFPTYNLTTVSQPLPAMVAATVTMLIAKIESRNVEPEHLLIGGQLVVRGSTKAQSVSTK
ncbi:LacI family DNA-binding transcriptional regulator [Rhizobium sp. BK176]|uniref:LacI family DNA-binding transcriptional regulator n=1 Tax=Rhizobium sp. BK176 TaxID=2587071 RepID=UPI0021697EE0|nr:LacI family DNA-binding transcriptional regulator [Rhizobium sp. BK176]MCS4096467.1 DNA-binding LacI/PurR family transcriptional regulator [Rhizobium sp. BK176]